MKLTIEEVDPLALDKQRAERERFHAANAKIFTPGERQMFKRRQMLRKVEGLYVDVPHSSDGLGVYHTDRWAIEEELRRLWAMEDKGEEGEK